MLLLHCLFLWPTRVKRGGETAGLRLIARFARSVLQGGGRQGAEFPSAEIPICGARRAQRNQ